MSQLHVFSSPVGGTVELGVNARLIHDCPWRRGDEELLVDAVSEAVRDAACHVSNMRRVKSSGAL